MKYSDFLVGLGLTFTGIILVSLIILVSWAAYKNSKIRYNLTIGDKEYSNVYEYNDHTYRLQDGSTLRIGENETFTLKEIK